MTTPFLLSCGAMLMFLTLTITTDAGAKGTPTALIFPPGTSKNESVRAATQLDAAIVAVGRLPSILIVVPYSEIDSNEIRKAGAWLALRGDNSVLCDKTKITDPGLST